jgi:hypothetical protein
MDAKPRLLEQVRYKLRAKHYSYRTEQQYVAWIRRFILHHGKRHPKEMSGVELLYALEQKYPKAHAEWAWQYVFPAARPIRDSRSGVIRRHHVH